MSDRFDPFQIDGVVLLLGDDKKPRPIASNAVTFDCPADYPAVDQPDKEAWLDGGNRLHYWSERHDMMRVVRPMVKPLFDRTDGHTFLIVETRYNKEKLFVETAEWPSSAKSKTGTKRKRKRPGK